MALFRARFLADDIYQITGEALQRRGIRLLLADLDNTLAPYGAVSYTHLTLPTSFTV